MSVVSVREKDRRAAVQLSEAFLSDLLWEPNLTAHFAGALCNSQYGFFMKRLMNWIAKKSGHMTDPNQDYECTDWDAVDAFASEFVSRVRNTHGKGVAGSCESCEHDPLSEAFIGSRQIRTFP